MFYAKSTGGFYDPSSRTKYEKNGNWPDDVVEISAELYAEIQNRPKNKIVVTDENGFPALADPPKATSSHVWERIKAERDRRTETGGCAVTVSGVDKWFHSDKLSRSKLLGLVLSALSGNGLPAGLKWKTMDGSYVEMTAVLAAQVVSASTLSDIAIFTAAEAHNAAMESAIDPSAYDFSSDWPKMFGE